MRKIICILMALIMILSFAACGQGTTESAGSSFDSGSSESSNEEAVSSEIKNVILIIGDGMGSEHIAAGELYYEKDYAFNEWQGVRVNTNSFDGSKHATPITDSAASATALATGTLTQNYYIGVDSAKKDLTTIMDIAQEKGKATGIVTTDALTGATPSSFSAHTDNRYDANKIIEDQLASGINLLCGLEDVAYTAEYKDEFEQNGYTYCDDFKNKEGLMEKEKMLWQLQLDKQGSSREVALKDMTAFALDYLDQDEDGFVLMIEQAYIDKNSHNNSFSGMIYCMNSLADTVDAVMQWVGERTDTAVLVTADHETGDFCVSANPTALKNMTITVGGNSISYSFGSNGHSASDVMLFVHGITPDFKQCEYFKSSHVIKNIDIFYIMQDLVNTGKCN